MRVLLLADIHANWHALNAIQESFDLCLCSGDLVEYGPDPKPVLDWVRTNVKHCVRGNHDHGTGQDVPVVGAAGFRYLTMATRPHSVAITSDSEKRYLNRLPTTEMLTVDGKKIMLVHATPKDPLDEYTTGDRDVWEPRVAGLDVDFVIVGHTHVQFQLDLGRTTVVNPGAVGLPRDGDPCVRYAILEDGQLQLKSCPYPIEKTVAQVMDHPMLDERAKLMLVDVYRKGRLFHQTNLVPLQPTS